MSFTPITMSMSEVPKRQYQANPIQNLDNLDQLHDSSVLFFLWNNLTSPGFAVAIFLVGVVSLSIKGIIIKFVLFNAQNRPVNFLVLFEQITMFLCNGVLFVGSLTSIATGLPLFKFGGHSWCMINWFFGVGFYAFSSVNSFGLAVYRMIVMRWPLLGRNVIGDYNLMFGILAFMIFTASASMYFWVQGLNLSKVTPLTNFCTGRNNLFSSILAEYEGRSAADLAKGKGIQSLVLLVLLTLNVSELVCYIVIARDLFEQNKNMVGILTNKAITKRNKGSVITLSGQVMAFVIEVLISILTLVAVNGPLHVIEQSFIQIVMFLQSGAISVVQLATSQELNRYIRGDIKVGPA